VFKISGITLAVVMTLGGSAQAQAQTQAPADSGNPTPTYRINVVSRATRAVSYYQDHRPQPATRRSRHVSAVVLPTTGPAPLRAGLFFGKPPGCPDLVGVTRAPFSRDPC
jgi:hypothetical protein